MTKTFSYSRFAFLLGGLLLVYLIIRALFNEPLHDEIATYYFYIYHGDYLGPDMVIDANNHLLNSAICHFLYPLAKDNFFWYRLPSLLAFLLYFYSVFQLSKSLENKNLRWVMLLSFNTIPMMMEYFAYTRGYGISLGLFLFSLLQFHRFFTKLKTQNLIWAFVSLFLTVSANLTFIQTSLMVVCIVFLFLIQNKKLGWRFLVRNIFLCLLFLGGILPLILYALFLKESGALYYGELHGMWEVTGKSLTGYIFFNVDWPAVLIVASILGAIVWGLWRKIRVSNPLKKIDFQWLIYLLLFGNLAAIWFLALVLNVNYPADRTAFALVLLFLFGLLFALDHLKGKLVWLSLLLLYFPISFIAKMSLHSSVFSPDDRMTKTFYKEVKKHVDSETTLMIYGIMRWSWPFLESYEKEKAPMYNSYNTNHVFSDILIRKTNYEYNPKIFALYDTIATNPGSFHIAFKRKEKMVRELETESDLVSGKGSFTYFNLFETTDLPADRKEPYLLTVKGHLQTFTEKTKLQLIMAITDPEGNLTNYEFYPFEYTYQGEKINDSFSHHFILPEIPEKANLLKVYFWSRQEDLIEVKNAKCYIYHLKEKQNGSR